MLNLTQSSPSHALAKLVPFSHLPHPVLPSHAKVEEPKRSQQAQSNRQRLARLDRPWNAASSQHNTGQQTQLNTIGLAVGDAVATERVQCANGAPSRDRGHGAGAHIACGAAACGQDGEDVGNVFERLREWSGLAWSWHDDAVIDNEMREDVPYCWS